ncbi:DUF4272 domain-containing protein [Paenibacillus lentus]|uniref:DUF4272 domain-containing protein n=1 Tax=Paenibacillus lentus TaxID=1338368 RepID=A0A3S8RQ58_9BACL|nr:DUF4272 domain-containing protein [Paenibacillus lentus]AZK44979.1 DUF4272 domain-containing protein [Paenibacillus lentus]
MRHFTIFASRNDTGDIPGLIAEVFADGYKIDGNSGEYVIQPRKWFNKNKMVIRVASEDTDPDYFANNIPGMMGFYDRIPFEDEQLKRLVLTQISVINTMLAIETDKDYDEAYLTLFQGLLRGVDGIGFIPDGTLADYDGRVIVHPDGRSGNAEFRPRACTRKIRGEEQVSAEGEQRKQETIAYLQSRNIPYIEGLPQLPPLADLHFKPREEIARRAVALLLVIQYACYILQDEGVEQSRQFVTEMLDKYGVTNALTENEADLLQQEEPEHQDAVNISWQYEAYWVLIWALGLVESLEFPNQTCDCDFAIQAVSSCDSFEEFLGKTSPRRPEEILDEADRNYRLHWACVNSRIKGESAPAGMNESIVMERRRALFWLIGSEGEEWDHISLDT